MEKTIYHGSDHIIEKPKFGYGKPYNDYGIGFYCTQNPNMAKEWGVGIDHNGYANRYEIECDGLTILDLNAPGYTMLQWLTILLENRDTGGRILVMAVPVAEMLPSRKALLIVALNQCDPW